MFCEVCKRDYDSMIYPECPYCNKLLPIDLNDTSTPNADEQLLAPQNFQLLSKDNSVQPLVSFNVVCPNCGTKNARNKRFCSNCLELLQNFTPNMEKENYNSEICRRLDHKTIIKHFNITARAFLMYFTDKKFNIDCPRCGQKTEWYLDNCKKCGQLVYWYQCGGTLKNGVKCNNKMKMSDIECNVCGQEGLFSFFKKLMSGRIRGKMADNIFNILEQVFGIDLTTDTFSAKIDQRTIQRIKGDAEQICGDIVELLETFSKGLKDFTFGLGNEDVELGDTFSAMKKNSWVTPDIITPTKSNNVLDIMDKRKQQIANGGKINDEDEEENVVDDEEEIHNLMPKAKSKKTSKKSTKIAKAPADDEDEEAEETTKDVNDEFWSPYDEDDPDATIKPPKKIK